MVRVDSFGVSQGGWESPSLEAFITGYTHVPVSNLVWSEREKDCSIRSKGPLAQHRSFLFPDSFRSYVTSPDHTQTA